MSAITEEIVRAEPAPVDLPDPELTGRDVLLMAASVVVKRGHCRGKMVDNKGRVCALGALRVAATGEVGYIETEESKPLLEARRILEKHISENGLGQSVIDWNDGNVPGFAFTKRAERHVAREMRRAAGRCA